jgi:DNA-directed RNA polymerase subunit omega|tara:strand:- start:3372 stop:3569 length:198 start_codon:yes stop_codon:yes gene_type:complete
MARVTIEDCLEKVRNRFELSVAAMKRAKKIYEGEPSLSNENNKPIVLALREIAEDKIVVVKTLKE